VLATSVSERWWVLRHPVSSTRRATGTEPAPPAPTTPLEPPDQLISLRRAAKLGGLTAHTLLQQVRRKRLWAIRPGREYRTTRTALHRYLISRGPQGRTSPLPSDYVAP
jgi:excisionase family DNA binding protein